MRGHSAAGKLLQRVYDLEFITQNFKVAWDEVSAEEVRGLRVLKEERDKYMREVAEREKQECGRER